MENNTALSPSSTVPPSDGKPKPATTNTTKKPAKKPKKAKAAKSAKKAKTTKAKSALTDTLHLSDKMAARLEQFRKHIHRNVATRAELREANKRLFKKLWSPAYITKNVAFKTEVPGLYSLVAHKGKAATAAAVKAHLAAKAKPVKKAAKSKKAG